LVEDFSHQSRKSSIVVGPAICWIRWRSRFVGPNLLCLSEEETRITCKYVYFACNINILLYVHNEASITIVTNVVIYGIVYPCMFLLSSFCFTFCAKCFYMNIQMSLASLALSPKLYQIIILFD
jgi:hypothetical protein